MESIILPGSDPVVLQKFTGISVECTVSIFRVEDMLHMQRASLLTDPYSLLTGLRGFTSERIVLLITLLVFMESK
jgi:hypothetical protein